MIDDELQEVHFILYTFSGNNIRARLHCLKLSSLWVKTVRAKLTFATPYRKRTASAPLTNRFGYFTVWLDRMQRPCILTEH